MPPLTKNVKTAYHSTNTVIHPPAPIKFHHRLVLGIHALATAPQSQA